MKYIFWSLLILLIFIRYIVAKPHYSDGSNLKIISIVLNDPVNIGYSQIVNLVGIKIYLPTDREIYYGDKLTIEGKYNKGEIKNAKIISLERNVGILVVIRKSLLDFYNTTLSEPYSSLAVGIVFGAKQNLPRSFSDHLINTGTTHVVVASGMNVTMTASFVMSLLILVTQRKKAIIVSLVAIWIYIVIVGVNAPVIRAGIMSTLALTGQLFGRIQNTLRLFFISIFAMLVLKPLWIEDVGFLLSFASTLSLILFQDKLNKKLRFVPSLIREDLATSIAAQVLSSPVIFWKFGRVSLIGPFINAIVLWTISPIMIIGFLAGLIGLVWTPLARIILLSSYPFLWWFVSIISIF